MCGGVGQKAGEGERGGSEGRREGGRWTVLVVSARGHVRYCCWRPDSCLVCRCVRRTGAVCEQSDRQAYQRDHFFPEARPWRRPQTLSPLPCCRESLCAADDRFDFARVCNAFALSTRGRATPRKLDRIRYCWSSSTIRKIFRVAVKIVCYLVD